MAAFQFPDPAEQQTVVNPITGSTYQWKEDPGKWVVAIKIREVGDIIWEGDNPPNPIGDYKLWYSTDTLELYFHYCDANGVCAWVPTSAPITMLEDLDNSVFELGQLLNQVNMAASTNENEIQTIKDSLGQVTLQEVLDNGNVADKGAEFGGPITSNGIFNQGDATFKFGGGQGVVIDSGSTFEPMLELKSYTGPDQRKEVFSVNAKGNANLLGKLTLAPGESGNQAATYGQLATLAEQIEQINPTYERGKYNFSQTEVTGSTETRGTYNLVRKNNSSDSAADRQACEDAFNTCKRIPDADIIDCQREYDSCLANIPANGTIDTYIDKFSEVKQIKFSKYDADGAKHEWTDVAVGQLVDIFNDDNDDYFVGTITAIDNGTSVVTLDVDRVQAKGNATGKARIKVFTLNNEIDELTNYVRKTGDTMTGELIIIPRKGSAPSLELLPAPEAPDERAVIFTRNKDNQISFHVNAVGSPKAGTKNNPFIATEDRDLTTKKYVDDAIAAFGGPYGVAYKYRGEDQKAQDLEPGEFFRSSSNGNFYVSCKDLHGRLLFPSQSYTKRYTGILKIYDGAGDVKHMMYFVEAIVGNSSNNYVRYTLQDNLINAPAWTSGITYYLADGLFLPY